MDPNRVISFKQPLSADRLVKLDLPEVQLDPSQPRKLELREGTSNEWSQFEIDKFGVDGRVRLTVPGGGTQQSRWIDLSKSEYRWLA